MSGNYSLYHMLPYCFESRATLLIFTTMLITNGLILTPLLFFVIYLGVQQWRRQRSASATATLSHSDFFTYNMATLELISMSGSLFYCFGDYLGKHLQAFGNSVFFLTSPGQTLIHLLACLERYLAVVHPITYMGLRQSSALKIRNITTSCIWLLCSGMMVLTNVVSSSALTAMNCSIMVSSVVLVSFFSYSVLQVLNNPGPGEVSGDRQRVDSSKQKAFYTIVAIMVAELFRIVGVLVCSVLFDSLVRNDLTCTVGSSFVWLAVPCGLVLPMLYLQKAGKLPSCKGKSESV